MTHLALCLSPASQAASQCDLIGFLGRGGKTADHHQSLHDLELGVAIAGLLQQHAHHLFYMMHCHIIASHQKYAHMNPNLLHHQLLP